MIEYEDNKRFVNGLQRLIGQLEGIQKMHKLGRPPIDVLNQLMAGYAVLFKLTYKQYDKIVRADLSDQIAILRLTQNLSVETLEILSASTEHIITFETNKLPKIEYQMKLIH